MTRSIRVMFFALAVACAVSAVARPEDLVPDAPALAAAAAVAEQPLAEQPLGERVMEALNPSQVCPHCGKTFTQNRSMWMLIVGFLGQIVFTGRFVVQWIASERRKQSYFPIVFWYLSIVGSLMLFAYAISIMAWPIILGQGFGVLVYARNLALIAKHKKTTAEEPPVGE